MVKEEKIMPRGRGRGGMGGTYVCVCLCTECLMN